MPTLSPTAVLSRVEPGVLGALLGLPAGLQRRLAGRPVVRDGQQLEVETQLLLRLQALSRRGELRFGPDGRRGLDRDSALVGGSQPIGEYRELEVAGADGPIPARLYVPQALLRSTEDPLLVFFHGGGFVTGGLDSHDASCRVVAERAGVRVLSVGYRLAPEHPFPAAPQDCIAAYRWVAEHVDQLGADRGRLAVGGDSAGGNLAALTAIQAAREGLPLRFQLLVYPVTDLAATTESRDVFAEGFFLTRTAMDQASEQYLAGHTPTDPLASPIRADLPTGLASAYLATAGFDPLRDEGEAYAEKLAEAGVEVTVRRFGGHIHSFFNVVGVGRAPRTAVEEIADALAAGL